MTSKKALSGKRAALPMASDPTKAFAKDWTGLFHSSRYDMKRLKEAMLLLVVRDEPLGPEWLDHPPVGEWANHQGCHVGGDLLLINCLSGTGDGEQIIPVRAGTYSDLFE
jgi:mRNA interferase YafQ